MIIGTTKLTCGKRPHHRAVPCTGVLAVLPGTWVKGRLLQRGEEAPAGSGSLVCRTCRAKWQVVPVWDEMREAA